jgi:hypothetical protein
MNSYRSRTATLETPSKTVLRSVFGGHSPHIVGKRFPELWDIEELINEINSQLFYLLAQIYAVEPYTEQSANELCFKAGMIKVIQD